MVLEVAGSSPVCHPQEFLNMRHPVTLNQPIVLADQAEEVDQESDTVETIKLTEQWSEYFQEKCASMFIAPVKGSWIINGIPLSESKGYRRGIDTLLLFEISYPYRRH